MQFTNYWQQFEHTGRVEDYLKYLQSAEKEEPPAGAECKSPLVDCLNYLRSTEGTDFPNACCSSTSVDCRAEGCTDLNAREDGSCRNPCM